LTWANPSYILPGTWDWGDPIKDKQKKNKEVRFLIKQTLNDKIENKINKKTMQKKKEIKRIRTQFDIKIKWN
jgi:hypothetical protein